MELQPDSRPEVTETIRLRVLGTQIRHGINRDFPTDYPGPWGSRSTTGFVLEDASLDADAVPTQVSRLQNGVRIRIGDPNRLVPPGIHTYTIRYLTWWQVSFGPDEDGLDWNVTGNGWNRPIDPVRREVAPGMLGSSHGYPAFSTWSRPGRSPFMRG